jgi:ATPase family associated with various cellular activities (AAA)
MEHPKTYCLHPEVEHSISEWIKKRDKPAVLLLGRPGIGKTTLALRVFKEAGLRPIEFNASHTRSGTSFRKTILPLLREGGIIQMMESGKCGGIGVLLDEIDGLSNGERGGLNELHAYLKSPEAKQGRHLILISNTIDSRTLQQIAKLCLTFEIEPVKKDRLKEWLQKDIPDVYNGDLRSLQRQIAGLETSHETIDIPEGVMPVAAWTLWGEWDPLLEFDIENNEGNLASLICLENIPERIEASLGNTKEAWNMYLTLFDAYRTSDQGDFWAFFYQCWTILPVSLRLKLKIMSLRLVQEAPLPEGARILQTGDFRYTPVLTKQSAMFNAWKLLCEVAEKHNIPVRLAPMFSELDIRSGALRTDKVRRYQAISLEHLKTLYTVEASVSASSPT